MRTALTIAGSDSIGGAGIQADIRAMTSVGVHPATVITAVTAQNTCKVEEIYPMSPEAVQCQLETVLEDCDIRAIKTGMLYSADIVDVVVDVLEDHDVPLVVDPVMIATVGDGLCDDTLTRALKKKLLPICELVTPNRHEAEVLADMRIENEDDVMFACEIIGKQGSSVLLKGGHMDGRSVTDYLYLSSEFTKIVNPRIQKAGHGSGCVLSAFITANMAIGNDLINSVMISRKLIQDSIAGQYEVGLGEAVVNPNVKGGNDKIKFDVLEAVDKAAREICDTLPTELVTKGGINIAYAMPNAAGPEEIAAVNGRMVVHNGMLLKNGEARLGSAEHLSYVILEIMKKNPKMRCIMNIRYNDEVESVIEEVGLTVGNFDKRKKSIAESTSNAIREVGHVPDIIIDRNDRTLRIIGKNPTDVLDKLDLIL